MYNLITGKRKKFDLNNADVTYKVHYLGNVMTSIMKGEGCVDKAIQILWDNHVKYNGQAGLKMTLTITQGGVRVNTKASGITDYYGHRIHYIIAHPLHPKLFVWVYQHVGKNLKTEMRCHAVMCKHTNDAKLIEYLLSERLKRLLDEYKREKRRSQNSRLLLNTFKILHMGSKKRVCSTSNYKPPVQRGMCSAPKLDDVKEEDEEYEDELLCSGGHHSGNSVVDEDTEDAESTSTTTEEKIFKLKLTDDSTSVYSSCFTGVDSGIDGDEFINELQIVQATNTSDEDENENVKDHYLQDKYNSVLEDHQAYVQVSYEFSSDLSKPQLKQEEYDELNNLKNSYIHRENSNSFRLRNPFRRKVDTHSSFSSHSTYKKAKDKEEEMNMQEEKQKSFNLFLKSVDKNNSIISELGNSIKNSSDLKGF